MRVDKLDIDNFKNLKNFHIDIDETQLTSVFIGRNGAGKSNLIEALVIIFRDLDLNVPTTNFSYTVTYRCSSHIITVDNSKLDGKKGFNVDGESISKSAFYKERENYLPAHVFAYYSGPSNRLESHFSKHQRKFYNALLNGKDEVIRPLFYARLIHSNFVLLAFFSFFEETNSQFLREYLDIISVESILFVLKKASWVKEKSGLKYAKSELWGARGVVREFLNDLYRLSLAPLKETTSFDEGFKPVKKEVTYLFLKDQKKLMEFSERYKNNVEFFKHLESMYLSDLIEEIRIKVRKSDGTVITFNELSEGEQQLLTVLGLLKFTKSKESLFLLDEPDTHLNPAWKFDYLKLIQDVVEPSENSQVILSTHDPIVIGGLKKEAVTIFDRCNNQTVIKTPEVDPKGMGVAGLLTSDLFGLPSTLDPDTQKDLDRKRQLLYKENKTVAEQDELRHLERELENLGFTRTTRDPLYDKFIERLFARPEFQSKPITDVERKQMAALTDDILAEILEEEKMEGKG
ncbi:AAA family ATPase [Pygmaiobacter massiliensis]|uniref:AAA family ATPase n=1 Tax=Pygmaiobacter massiliensis TaxID=1917873 RepID=UPI0015E0D42D|nr:AAA family ATPase [Pygmaiobacter massiliensis]